MSGGVTFDIDFATMTVDRYLEKTVRDQVYNDLSLLGWIEGAMGGFDKIEGGHNILVTVNKAKNSQVSSYAGYDEFNNTPQEIATNAYYGWKGYYVSVVAQAFELLRNQSAEGQMNLWANRVDAALMALRDTLNTHAFSDGTGNSGKNILGLGILVDSAGTLGGIARSSNSWWQSIEKNAAGSLTIDGANGLMRALHDASPGSGSYLVDMIMTTFTVMEYYERLLSNGIRYNSLGRGDASFQSLAFRGIPLKGDKGCTSGTLFGLASSTFRGYIHPQRNFANTDVANAMNGDLNADAYIQHILAWPELINVEPRRNFKITGITG